MLTCILAKNLCAEVKECQKTEILALNMLTFLLLFSHRLGWLSYALIGMHKGNLKAFPMIYLR